MRTIVLCIIFCTLIFSCKPQSESNTQDVSKSQAEPQKEVQISPILKDILEFAEINTKQNVDINNLLITKAVDSSGNTTPIHIEEAVQLYKDITKSKQVDRLPVFEILNTDKAILIVTGKGYMDVIWAKIMVDRLKKKILKVAFDHKGESEGYGASITLGSFENQFQDTDISFINPTFGLLQGGKNISKGNQQIDGISGATITSLATIEMMNTGLQQYAGYFRKTSNR
ncbi:FMN-binding protein [Aquimarina sp. MMG016]|uniref:FMN-binding protein n=1 Tax=Aquimarina sp. MMG016 TaxID=2822690 RepID=UPI001B3A2D0D|nr:FMN-binding protein [Aquimarina sp. MMG016]MBQ4822120.1 FMN-binding protein [Aquimarina sp. MMG016]